MDQLNEGHQLYTATACVRCHGAESIYQYDNNEWIGIIDRMAGKARITDSQKDAISKYVFAIKATQAK
jgi:mono/diheme cytochrome c family protein